jgi:hypothetical protein
VRTRPIEAVAIPHRGVVERAVAHRAVRAVRACPRGITATARDSQQMGFDRHGAHCTPGWCLFALVGAPRSTPNWLPPKRTTTQTPRGGWPACSPINQVRCSGGRLRELGISTSERAFATTGRRQSCRTWPAIVPRCSSGCGASRSPGRSTSHGWRLKALTWSSDRTVGGVISSWQRAGATCRSGPPTRGSTRGFSVAIPFWTRAGLHR